MPDQESLLNTLDAINLILPSDITKNSTNNGVELKGYMNLQALRDKAAEFRAGYKNWRMQGAKGSRGETKDVFTTRGNVSNIKRQSTTELIEDNLPIPEALKSSEDPNWLRFYYNPFSSLDSEFSRSLRLKNSLLRKLPSNIRKPSYERNKENVKNWIIHIGIGGFHRSHQAVYLDDLLTKNNELNPSQELEWAICGVGLFPFDKKMKDALEQQDYLYTVWTRSSQRSEARVIGSILDFKLVYEDVYDSILLLCNENTKIVSLTVTEKGYCLSSNGSLDVDNQNVKKDIKEFQNWYYIIEKKEENQKINSPNTVVAYITLGLLYRYIHGLNTITIQSCDNLPENGDIIKKVILQYIDCIIQQNEGICILTEFKNWVVGNIHFPNSMVDRITPVTQLEHKELLLRDFRIDDEWPVVAEEFTQWIIEDKFNIRPAWESVGALLVNEVVVYEKMKLRLLNGGHSAIAYLSYLSGFRFVDDAVCDITISSFLRAYMDEATPTIVSRAIDVERYKDKIIERFSNRFIKDSILRIAEDGSSKFYSTMKDVIIELIGFNNHTHYCALAFAGFIRFMSGIDEQENPIPIKDGNKDIIQKLCLEVIKDPLNKTAIQNIVHQIFGDAVSSHTSFCCELALTLHCILNYGVKDVLHSSTPHCLLIKNISSNFDQTKKFLDFVSGLNTLAP